MGWYITKLLYKIFSLLINSVISEWCFIAITEQLCGLPQRQFIVFEVLFWFVVRNFMFYLISFRVYFVQTLMRICLHSQWHQFSLGKFGQCFVCQQPVAARAAKTWATQIWTEKRRFFKENLREQIVCVWQTPWALLSQIQFFSFLMIKVACIHSAPSTN